MRNYAEKREIELGGIAAAGIGKPPPSASRPPHRGPVSIRRTRSCRSRKFLPLEATSGGELAKTAASTLSGVSSTSFAVISGRFMGTLAGTRHPDARDMGIVCWCNPGSERTGVPGSVTIATLAEEVATGSRSDRGAVRARRRCDRGKVDIRRLAAVLTRTQAACEMTSYFERPLRDHSLHSSLEPHWTTSRHRRPT